MRLEQLLKDLCGNRSWEQMSRETGDRINGTHPGPPIYGPPRVSRARLSAIAGGDLRKWIDPETATGIALAGDIPVRTVWLATGVSLGLPDDELFVGGREAEARGMLAAGWHDLDPPRARTLHDVSSTLVNGQRAEHRITELEDENARLRAARASPQRART